MRDGTHIRHALNGQGEFRIQGTNYRVDGYCETTNTVYEFLGCLFHGCSICWPQQTVPLQKTGETPQLLLNKTRSRLRDLKALGYNLVTIWEHEFRQQLQDDNDLLEFSNRLDIVPRLVMRDAFFGGKYIYNVFVCNINKYMF